MLITEQIKTQRNQLKIKTKITKMTATTEKRPATQQEKDVLLFLNELRESGSTNMFGATPYVVKAFKIPQDEARQMVSLWMRNFDSDGNYEEVY